ncbi:MAG: hypothetical protein IKE58_00295 [Blautia sp.]|nr:hypothetical protein [Blautia sp.]
MLIRLGGLLFSYETQDPLVQAHLLPFCVEDSEADPGQEQFQVEKKHFDEIYARLRTSKDADKNYESYLEEMALLWTINNILLTHDGFFLHGAAISFDDMACIFTAPSGTGKTTHIRLWRECFGQRVQVINGDKPFIRLTDGEWRVFPNPWNGKEGWGGRCEKPLKGLCFLARSGGGNRIRPMKPDEALPLLFEQTVMPEEKELIRSYMSVMSRFLREVPCWQLFCEPSREAALVSRDAMFGK